MRSPEESIQLEPVEGNWSVEDVMRRVSDIDVATLATIDERGTLSSRPMKVQHHGTNGEVWFVANGTADWVANCNGCAVNVALQDGRGWVSFAGRLELSRDDALIERFHDETRSRIAPVDVVILRCVTEEIEWWHQATSAKRLLGELIEYVTGTEWPADGHGRLIARAAQA